MKQIILFLLLITSGTALAGPDTPARLRQLKTELSSVQQEQQSTYQNYQMTKEPRRIEVQEGSPPMAQYPYGIDINTPPTNSGAALAGADTSARLRQLKTELSSVQQEQQSTYQNYQMTKELRRLEVQESSPPMAQYPYGMDINTPPPNYDDVLRMQLEREERIQQYTNDLSRLTKGFLELEGRRKLLLQQIRELEQHLDE